MCMSTELKLREIANSSTAVCVVSQEEENRLKKYCEAENIAFIERDLDDEELIPYPFFAMVTKSLDGNYHIDWTCFAKGQRSRIIPSLAIYPLSQFEK